MDSGNSKTVRIDRPLTAGERALLEWLVANSQEPEKYARQVSTLRVVGLCGCGCPSIDCIPDGQAAGARIVADFVGFTPEDQQVGVLLWVRADQLAGTEVYPLDDIKGAFKPPRPDSLRTFEQVRP